eukprot:TRINITY_DN12794_c0_g1_i1.p1 TRINITY_DN12794_c0_g1~~TRINITY_DN12794_c0_g1_i1.p1  ORF type:complete len:1153 (+),score=100.03 TRINITY_DN12794_c0_g1_i1:1125-4583(+)
MGGWALAPGAAAGSAAMCYEVFSTQETWSDAQSSCQGQGAVLATVGSEQQNEVIRARSPGASCWIGLNDMATECDADPVCTGWVWVEHGSTNPVFRKWLAGQPNAQSASGPQDQDCVILSSGDGTWQDRSCAETQPYACMRPANQPPSASPQLPTRNPTAVPSGPPSRAPTPRAPTPAPSAAPVSPSASPAAPSARPTTQPEAPLGPPTASPAPPPSDPPTTEPTRTPWHPPSQGPAAAPSGAPAAPTPWPSSAPSPQPSRRPSPAPSGSPAAPSRSPHAPPMQQPSPPPTSPPAQSPSGPPSRAPARAPTERPTPAPAARPAPQPIHPPSAAPRAVSSPTPRPARPTPGPSRAPTARPVQEPSAAPSRAPSSTPADPTRSPTIPPTIWPTRGPAEPTSRRPSTFPSPRPIAPTPGPTAPPVHRPTVAPSRHPSRRSLPPAQSPTAGPGHRPSQQPTGRPHPLLSLPPAVGRAATPAPRASPSAAPAAPGSPPASSASPRHPPAAAGPPSAAPAVPPARGLREAGGEFESAEQAARLAGPAGSRAAILLNLDCFVDDLDLSHDEEIDLEFHPIGAPLGSHHQRYFTGALLWNNVIVLSVLCILLAAGTVRAMLAKEVACPLPTSHLAAVRFPSFAYVPYQYLVQGTVLSAAHCAFFPSRGGPGTQAVGVFILILMATTPVLIWWAVLRGPRFQACHNFDSVLAEKGLRWGKVGNAVYRIVYGSVVWTSTGGHFVERYGMIFEGYGPGKQWWMMPELGHLVSIALFAAWRPGSRLSCDVRNFSVAALLLAYLVGLVVVRPYLAPLTSGLQAMIAVLNVLAVVAIAAGLSSGNAGLLRSGSAVLLVSAIFQFVLLACDVLAYLGDLCVGRRRRGWAAGAGDVLSRCVSEAVGPDHPRRYSSLGSAPEESPLHPRSVPEMLELFSLASGLESTVAAITSPRLPSAGRSSVMRDLVSPGGSSRQGPAPPRRRSNPAGGGGSVGGGELSVARTTSGSVAPSAGRPPGAARPGADADGRRRLTRPQHSGPRGARRHTMSAVAGPPGLVGSPRSPMRSRLGSAGAAEAFAGPEGRVRELHSLRARSGSAGFDSPAGGSPRSVRARRGSPAEGAPATPTREVKSVRTRSAGSMESPAQTALPQGRTDSPAAAVLPDTHQL